MKCVHCDHDTNYRGRKDTKCCSNCQKPFAFEPKTDKHRFTDKAFLAAADHLSEGGGSYFTDRQLWYFLEEQLRRRRSKSGRVEVALLVIGSGFLAGFLGYAMMADSGGAVALAVVTCIVLALVGASQLTYHRRIRRHGVLLDFDHFERALLGRWHNVHGQLRGLTSARKLVSRPPADAEQDLTEYSVDRAVITDRADTAAMLIANRVHFEQQCVILSIDGYPEAVLSQAQQMLRGSVTLQVLALHDASVDGLRLVGRLATAHWLPDGASTTDLGLTPALVRRNRLPSPRGAPAAVQTRFRVGLSPDDLTWLESGYTTHLDAYSPRAVMTAISRGFAASSVESGGWTQQAERDATVDRSGDSSGFYYWGSTDGDSASEDSDG